MARRLTPAEENAHFKEREERRERIIERNKQRRKRGTIQIPKKKKKKVLPFGASLAESIAHIRRRRQPLEPRR